MGGRKIKRGSSGGRKTKKRGVGGNNTREEGFKDKMTGILVIFSILVIVNILVCLLTNF